MRKPEFEFQGPFCLNTTFGLEQLASRGMTTKIAFANSAHATIFPRSTRFFPQTLKYLQATQPGRASPRPLWLLFSLLFAKIINVDCGFTLPRIDKGLITRIMSVFLKITGFFLQISWNFCALFQQT